MSCLELWLCFLIDNPDGYAKPVAVHSFGTLALSDVCIDRIVQVINKDGKHGTPENMLSVEADGELFHGRTWI